MDFFYYFNLFYHYNLIKNIYNNLFNFIINLGQVKNEINKITINDNNECPGSNKYCKST